MTESTAAASQPHIQRISEFVRPTVFGAFNIISYNKDGNFIFAITRGAFPQEHTLVRVQSAATFSMIARRSVRSGNASRKRAARCSSSRGSTISWLIRTIVRAVRS